MVVVFDLSQGQVSVEQVSGWDVGLLIIIMNSCLLLFLEKFLFKHKQCRYVYKPAPHWCVAGQSEEWRQNICTCPELGELCFVIICSVTLWHCLL